MLTLIRCLFHPRVTAVARKRPRSFCQKCRWQVTPKHAYTRESTKSEWADYARVQAECGNLSGNEPTRNSPGNTRSQSSQPDEPLWTDPGLKSGISLSELISTFKKKAQAGNELSNILPKSSHARKKPPPKAITISMHWRCHVCLVWISSSALYWVASRCLARLFARKNHPYNRKTPPYHYSRRLFIQGHGSGNLSVLQTQNIRSTLLRTKELSWVPF